MSALVERARTRARRPSPAVARAIRQAAGVSQIEVARELGVHPVTVARWEAGTRRPGGETALRYIALLDELREVAS